MALGTKAILVMTMPVTTHLSLTFFKAKDSPQPRFAQLHHRQCREIPSLTMASDVFPRSHIQTIALFQRTMEARAARQLAFLTRATAASLSSASVKATA